MLLKPSHDLCLYLLGDMLAPLLKIDAIFHACVWNSLGTSWQKLGAKKFYGKTKLSFTYAYLPGVNYLLSAPNPLPHNLLSHVQDNGVRITPPGRQVRVLNTFEGKKIFWKTYYLKYFQYYLKIKYLDISKS